MRLIQCSLPVSHRNLLIGLFGWIISDVVCKCGGSITKKLTRQRLFVEKVYCVHLLARAMTMPLRVHEDAVKCPTRSCWATDWRRRVLSTGCAHRSSIGLVSCISSLPASSTPSTVSWSVSFSHRRICEPSSDDGCDWSRCFFDGSSDCDRGLMSRRPTSHPHSTTSI